MVVVRSETYGFEIRRRGSKVRRGRLELTKNRYSDFDRISIVALGLSKSALGLSKSSLLVTITGIKVYKVSQNVM